MSALGVRTRNVLDHVGLPDPTPEYVVSWIRANVPPGHNDQQRMRAFLLKQKNCGPEMAQEILAFAFGDEYLKRLRIRVVCSACGAAANLQASGTTCDKFTQWWASEHKHEENHG
jgi:hypothetical protein